MWEQFKTSLVQSSPCLQVKGSYNQAIAVVIKALLSRVGQDIRLGYKCSYGLVITTLDL